ncbi:MAG: ABC transporter ATP-binding protein [Clostridiales bacterium]|nr:ABC transporter ATP-binding protein [Clostridiales bacterium]
MELLNIKNLTKTIKKKKILDNISLTVNSGEIVGFLGPNGAGKTTTIKLAMGLLRITSGTIEICGHDIESNFEDAIENVGGIIEDPDLYKNLTGRENLEYFASMYKNVNSNNIDDIVELVKMGRRIDDKVRTYSLGMRQRIGIAQALLHNPRLLVLDEPTNGLDPIGIKELRDMLKFLSREAGVGVFISSHLLSEMELMCDRICIIDEGVIIGEKTIHEEVELANEIVHEYILETDDNDKVIEYLGSLNANCRLENGGVVLVMKRGEIPNIIKNLVKQEIDIYAVNEKHRSLEQDFISMTTGTKTQIR